MADALDRLSTWAAPLLAGLSLPRRRAAMTQVATYLRRSQAERIAAQAPLAVQAALANAKRAVREGDAAAEAELQPALVRLVASEDARIGMQAFLTRTEAEFVGR